MSSRQDQLAASNPLVKRSGSPALSLAVLQEAAQQSGQELIVLEGGRYQIGRIVISPIGLVLPADISAEEWQGIGAFIRLFKRALRWWVGDWINAAETAWGDKYKAAIQLTGYKYETLRNIANICRSVDLSLRSDALSVRHAQEIAPLQRDAQEWFAAQVRDHGWSVRRLTREIYKWQHEGNDPPKITRTTWEQQVQNVRGYLESIAESIATDGVVNGSIIANVEAWFAELRASGKVK